MRRHVRLAITAAIVVLLLGGVLASMAFAQGPSWYFTYYPGAPGYNPYFTPPGALGYNYAFSPLSGYASSYPYNYGYDLYRFGYSYNALPGCAPCAPASPKTAYPQGYAPQSVYPAPIPPQLTYPTPNSPQLVYPTPEPLPQLVYPTAVPPQTVYVTPAPPQPGVAQACSSTEPCPPPQPQYATMAWGTFGTFENWAHKFRQEHCCCPTDRDVADFWASQTYFQQTGQTPFSGGFCWQ
jgi:hypothetical protein